MDRFPDLNSQVEDSVDEYEQLDVTHGRPLASEAWGTTAAEQRAGEPLDIRLAHEVPESQGGALAADNLDEAGRIVEPDEGAREDVDSDAVGRLSGDTRGLSAEEAAVHLVVEPGPER